jgi:hypothetical protein
MIYILNERFIAMTTIKRSYTNSILVINRAQFYYFKIRKKFKVYFQVTLRK